MIDFTTIPPKIKGKKNRLVIDNLSEVMSPYIQHQPHGQYVGTKAILQDLEKRVEKMETPDECLLVPYKDFGDYIFDLKAVYVENNTRYVVYNFFGTAS